MPPVLRPLLLVLGLAACVPQPGNQFAPVDYGSGVGFGSYGEYEARRLAGERDLAGGVPGGATGPAAAAPAISAEELRAAGLPAGADGAAEPGPLPAADPVPTRSIDDAFDAATGRSEPQASARPAAPAMPGSRSSAAISDEQSFAAVSARETIESDAERLARQRAAYRVIQPRAVPQRQGPAGPNIVQYALSTSHPVGRQVHARGGLFAERRFRRACAEFASPDLAQQEFLRRGGPERDRLGVDPDGDGYACAWDPAPFRAAQG